MPEGRFGRLRRALAVVIGTALGTAGLSVVALVATTSPAAAAAIPVSNNLDSGGGSLRFAIAQAEASAGPDTITIANSVSLITLTTGKLNYSADPSDLTINGGDGVTIHQSTPNVGVISYVGPKLTLQSMKIEGMNGAVAPAVSAGTGSLLLIGVEIADNHAGQNTEGGVYASGALTILNSSIHDNSTGTPPGGPSFGGFNAGGPVTITGSTIRNNSSGGSLAANVGGGFSNTTIDVTGSTIEGNSAPATGGSSTSVGGLSAVGAITVTRSTVNANNASNANGTAVGGIRSGSGTVTITNSTVTGNTTSISGIGSSVAAVFAPNVALKYATVALNTSPSPSGAVTATTSFTSFGSVIVQTQGGGKNCSVAGPVSGGYNYSDDATHAVSCMLSASSDSVGLANDPLIGALANNGGPTKTMLPQAGSPLIDTIPTASCASGITTDQRSSPRPGRAGCDRGAVELPKIPVYKPDGMVRKTASGADVGANRYYPTAQVVPTINAKRNATVTVYWRNQVDGNSVDKLKVKGTASTAGKFTVTYLQGAANKTASVTSSAGYLFPTFVAPAGFAPILTIKVRVSATATIGSTKAIALTTRSNTSPTKVDIVKMNVKVIP